MCRGAEECEEKGSDEKREYREGGENRERKERTVERLSAAAESSRERASGRVKAKRLAGGHANLL